MQCFNCGNDADMEVLMMINGKMKKISICMDCYKEQMSKMMEMMSDGSGNINPEEIQKKLFSFFQENKAEFEKFLGQAVDDENFSMDNLKPENFDVSHIDFGKAKEIPSWLKELFPDHEAFAQDKEEERKTYYSSNYYDDNEREINILLRSVNQKREELNKSVMDEDFIKAASLRDQMREINKRIMIIREFATESEG